MENGIEKIIIIGSGPAAFAACLYSHKHNPLILRGGYIGSNGPGGQLTTTTNVDNYPGFPNGIQGPDLMNQMMAQAQGLGIRQVDETVVCVNKVDGVFVVKTDSKTYVAQCVIVATGASARRLYTEGTHDGELWQKGISSCAVCDGYFYMDKVCCVIGGGDSAMEEVLYLAKICKKVYLVHRRDKFRCRNDKLELVRNTENIEILTPYTLRSAHGTDCLQSIKLYNDEEEIDLEIDGLFFGIGHDPNTSFLKHFCNDALDTDGYITVNEHMQTQLAGLYACGDVVDKIYKQAATAAHTGSIAGMSASAYISQGTSEE